MESRDKLLFEISELVTKAFDKSISDEEFDRLGQLIRTDPKGLEYYFDIISTYSCLEDTGEFNFGDAGGQNGESNNIMQAMHDLAEVEKFAPGIAPEELPEELPEESLEEQGESESPLQYTPRAPRPVGYRRRFLFKVACVIAICGSVIWFDQWLGEVTSITPQSTEPSPIIFRQASGPVVAHLVDQIDAAWDDSMQLPGREGQLTQSCYQLTEGYVNIRFDTGAKVTIEAPAKWTLLAGGNMELFRGRIYAVVPRKALGFTVMAGNAKIVDRGTEFGVEIDENNNTQLYVTEGKTLLYYGPRNGVKKEVAVNSGTARKVDTKGNVGQISAAPRQFVRQIDSKKGDVGKISMVPRTFGWQIDDVTGVVTLRRPEDVLLAETFVSDEIAPRLFRADFTTLDGREINLPADTEGKHNIVVFVEPPADYDQEEFQRELFAGFGQAVNDHRDKEMKLIVAFLTDDRNLVRSLMTRNKWEFEAVYMPEGIQSTLAVRYGTFSRDMLPKTYLVDPDGGIAEEFDGLAVRRDYHGKLQSRDRDGALNIFQAVKSFVRNYDVALGEQALMDKNYHEAARRLGFSFPASPVKSYNYHARGSLVANMALGNWEAALVDIDTLLQASRWRRKVIRENDHRIREEILRRIEEQGWDRYERSPGE